MTTELDPHFQSLDNAQALTLANYSAFIFSAKVPPSFMSDEPRILLAESLSTLALKTSIPSW